MMWWLRRVGNRRVLGWAAFALALVGLAWTLNLALPYEPRWVVRGAFGPGGITPDGKAYITRTVAGADVPNVNDLLMSPATPVQVGPVQYWDIATGRELHSALGDRGLVWHVGFSVDCNQLAALGPRPGDERRAELRWLDVSAGRERQTAFDHPPATWQPWISPGGGLVLLEDWNDPKQGVFLYETASLRLVAAVKHPHGLRLPWKWTPDGKALYVLTADADGTALLRRIAADGATATPLEGAGDWLAMAPDGKMLLTWSADADKAVLLWDLPAGTRRARIAVNASQLVWQGPVFTPDSRALRIATSKGTFGVWDVDSAHWLGKVPCAEGAAPRFLGPGAVVVQEDAGRLTCYQLRPFARLWQHDGNKLQAVEYLPDQECLVVLSSEDGQVLIPRRAIESSERGGDRLLLLDARTGTPALDVALDPDAVHTWLSRGQHFAVVTLHDNGGREPGPIRVFIEEHLLPMLTGNPPSDAVPTTVQVFDIAARTQRCRIHLPHAEIDAAALTPDGQTLVLHQTASAAGSAAILCYDVPPRRPWRFILGIPLGFGAALLVARFGWRRVRRGRKQGQPTAPAPPN